MEFRVGGSASIFAGDALPKFEPKPVTDDRDWLAFQEEQRQIVIRAREEDAAYELFYRWRWTLDQVKCSKPDLDRATLKRLRDLAKENRSYHEKYPFPEYSDGGSEGSYEPAHPMEELFS